MSKIARCELGVVMGGEILASLGLDPEKVRAVTVHPFSTEPDVHIHSEEKIPAAKAAEIDSGPMHGSMRMMPPVKVGSEPYYLISGTFNGWAFRIFAEVA